MDKKNHINMYSKMMIELNTQLDKSSIKILEHKYDYECFGSWFFICKHLGKSFRVVYDGKDNFLYIQEKIGKLKQLITGQVWNEIASTKIKALTTENVTNQVILVIGA